MIAHYLHTIVLSGYYDPKQWRKWADDCILNRNDTPLWIYDVSLAKNLEDFFLIISHPKTVEFVDNNNSYWEPDVVIGYYYLMYIEGRLSISDLLDRLTDEDDYSNESVVLDNNDFMTALLGSSAVDLYSLDTALKPQLYRACCQKKILELFSQDLIHY